MAADLEQYRKRVGQLAQELQEAQSIGENLAGKLGVATRRITELEAEMKRAVERLEKFGVKGPKQVWRAQNGLEQVLSTSKEETG